MEADVLTDLTTGKKYSLKPLGDVSGWGRLLGSCARCVVAAIRAPHCCCL